MSKLEPVHLEATHEVTNQVPPLEGYNAYTTDQPLIDAVKREAAAWADKRLTAYGELAGGELMQLGFTANENPPVLHTHDRYGNRSDRVAFHPAYHQILGRAIEHGIPSIAWTEDRQGAMATHTALGYLHTQAEAGTGCPLTMTFASIPALQNEPAVAALWQSRILSAEYDARFIPAEQKTGLTIGMGMTEKQGGSDVRVNTTRATATGSRDIDGNRVHEYAIIGHKWFFSAPMCDGFLVLAQTDAGPTCFLMPRFKPDGSQNSIHIQRLKEKLGNHSNASSEVEFHNAYALRVGDEGRGVPTIIDMVMMTRLDCMTGSASQMRQALVQAIHHARHRSAFGRLLVEQPLMQNVLADLALESEAAIALTMRVSRAVEAGRGGKVGTTGKADKRGAEPDQTEAGFARIATAIGKYWICKRAPMMVNEAQECLGGAGYVEESILPRLYREAPLNSIWEGCGNIQCLDVLRAMAREPGTVEALFGELEMARGVNALFDQSLDRVKADLNDKSDIEFRARDLVSRLAVLLQAAVLIGAENRDVSEAFCASRLGRAQYVFGELPTGLAVEKIIDRAFPLVAG